MNDKMSEREVYHVLPNSSGENWVVSREKSDFKKEFDNKQEAVDYATTAAKKASLGQIKVHTQDGNMEYEYTYGDDPRRTPS